MMRREGIGTGSGSRSGPVPGAMEPRTRSPVAPVQTASAASRSPITSPAAVFAGTAPLIATALVKATGWNESPALYVIVASIVALFVLVRMPEPSRLDLDAGVVPSAPQVDTAKAPVRAR
jgi:hypothetical protein